MKGPESYVLSAITEYLGIKGYVFKRNNSGTMFVKGPDRMRAIRLGEAGWPDIIGLTKAGQFFGIECKAKGKKPTEDQERVLKRIQDSGGKALVAYGVE